MKMKKREKLADWLEKWIPEDFLWWLIGVPLVVVFIFNKISDNGILGVASGIGSFILEIIGGILIGIIFYFVIAKLSHRNK